MAFGGGPFNNSYLSQLMNVSLFKLYKQIVERDLEVNINKIGKYSEQCLMAAKKSELCFRHD